MNLSRLLPNVTKLFASIRLAGRGDRKLGRLDFGILKVAIMVAALDGEILDSEIHAFEALAKKCRGYTVASARMCLDEALHCAGYLMAIAKVGGYTEKRRIAAFVDMAVGALPRGFVDGELSDLRRAFVLWVAMGVSDGTFSSIERKAIDALQDRFAHVATDEELQWKLMVPSLRMLDGTASRTKKVTLLEAGFIDRAAELVKGLSVASRRERAEAALAEFVNRV